MYLSSPLAVLMEPEYDTFIQVLSRVRFNTHLLKDLYDRVFRIPVEFCERF